MMIILFIFHYTVSAPSTSTNLKTHLRGTILTVTHDRISAIDTQLEDYIRIIEDLLKNKNNFIFDVEDYKRRATDIRLKLDLLQGEREILMELLKSI